MATQISRRQMLKMALGIGGGFVAGSVLVACGAPATTTAPGAGANTTAVPATTAAPAATAGTAAAAMTAADVALTDAEIIKIKDMKLRIGFNTNHRTDDFINTLIKGGETTANDYGIELLVGEANFDANKQLADIEALVQQKVNAIFMVAVDGDSISPAIQKANAANIPVIVVGGAPSRGTVLSVLNATAYDGCRESATFLMKQLNNTGKVGVITIPLALDTIKERDRGTTDGITQNGGQIVSTQATFKQDEALSLTQNIIQSTPDLAGIFATWSLAVNGALAAIEASGKTIPMAGFDAEVAGFQAFDKKNPNLYALSGQQAILQGKAGLDALCKSLLGQPVASSLLVPNMLVTRDNYKEMWDTLYPGAKAPWMA